MKELQLKYGCNPNQKPSRIFMEEGEFSRQLPVCLLPPASSMSLQRELLSACL